MAAAAAAVAHTAWAEAVAEERMAAGAVAILVAEEAELGVLWQEMARTTAHR